MKGSAVRVRASALPFARVEGRRNPRSGVRTPATMRRGAPQIAAECHERRGEITVKAFIAALAVGVLTLLVGASAASSAKPSLQHYMIGFANSPNAARSEERRVGKERRGGRA